MKAAFDSTASTSLVITYPLRYLVGHCVSLTLRICFVYWSERKMRFPITPIHTVRHHSLLGDNFRMRSSGGASLFVHGCEDSFGDAEDAGRGCESRNWAGGGCRLGRRIQQNYQKISSQGRLSQRIQPLLLSLHQIWAGNYVVWKLGRDIVPSILNNYYLP